MADKFVDRRLQAFLLKVVFQQDAVLQCLMPAFDLTLRLRMVRRAANMADLSLAQPFGKIASDVEWSIVRKQTQPVFDIGFLKTVKRIRLTVERQLQRAFHIASAFIVAQSFQAMISRE